MLIIHVSSPDNHVHFLQTITKKSSDMVGSCDQHMQWFVVALRYHCYYVEGKPNGVLLK